MFAQPDPSGYKEVAEGIKLKVLTYGQEMLMAEFRLSAGATLPKHDHPHEQNGYLVSGRIRLLVDGQEPFDSQPGGSWSVPGGVAHSAEVIEDSVVIEVFHPVREDFLE